MKNILPLIIFFGSLYSFAQKTFVSGQITDLESNNEPLPYAEVLVKETGAKILTDEKGNFQFENLEENTYTLVFSFVGYETKEIKTKVTSTKTTPINLFLKASTISLDDLVTLVSSSHENASK